MPATTALRPAPHETLLGALRRAFLPFALVAVLTATLLAATATTADAHSHKTRWDCLAHYESTHRWKINTGNGHYGGLQFSLSTWEYYGGPQYSGNKYPHKATRKEQIVIGKRTAYKGWKGRAAQGGANAWPNTWPLCS